jgi:hypothetical protein
MSSSPAPMSTHIPRSRAEPARKQACVLVPPVSTSPVSLLMGVSASLHDFSPRCRRGLVGGGILQRWIFCVRVARAPVVDSDLGIPTSTMEYGKFRAR